MFARFPNLAVLLVIGVALPTTSKGSSEIPPYGPVLDPHGGGNVCSLKLDCPKPPLGSRYGPDLDPHGHRLAVDPIGFGPDLDPIGFGPELDPHGYGPVLDPHGYGPVLDPIGYGPVLDPIGYRPEVDPHGLPVPDLARCARELLRGGKGKGLGELSRALRVA